MSARTVKLLALSYLVKTILFGIVWLAVPDFPQRAMTRARETWSRWSGTSVSATPAPAPVPVAVP